jgi:3-dehydroquinate synthase
VKILNPSVFINQMPPAAQLQKTLKAKNLIIFIDERVSEIPFVAQWLTGFPYVLRVSCGENLKTLEEYTRWSKKILPYLQGSLPQESALVVVGGGTAGDFGGFLASTLKRGIGLCHIPSTWLAAIDSAHGGKNGVNVDQFKNQVGTVYHPQKIFLVKELLFSQPSENLTSGNGEALKMAIIQGGSLFASFERTKNIDANFIWKVLPALIQGKYKVVKKDPLEKKGHRRILNLGHTLGHALESKNGLAHGMAVQMGTQFILDWSLELKFIKKSSHERIRKVLIKNTLKPISPISTEHLLSQLSQDKKHSLDGIHCVFVKNIGRPFIKKVKADDFITAAKRWGWAR